MLPVPDGPIAVLRPPADMDLSSLPSERVRITTTWKPDFDAWTRSGVATSTTANSAALAIVVVPRSKTLARALIAQAASCAPLVVVDGARTDGVDSLWRDVRARVSNVSDLTKAHGRLFWFAPGALFQDWQAPSPSLAADGFWRSGGVFSEDGIDPGSAALAAALPAQLPSRMADLGAGWGYLSTAVLRRSGVTSLDLVEAEARALDCARLNVTDPRAVFHWADATTFRADRGFDGIVMNPPFHVGRSADPALGRSFIAAAARLLSPAGQLWMVANRHLSYDAALSDHFRQVTEVVGTPAFRVTHAARPKR